MKKKSKNEELLKKYLKWPALFALLFVAMDVVFFIIKDRDAFLIGTLGVLISSLTAVILYLTFNAQITKALVGFAFSCGEDQLRLASEIEIPYAIVDEKGNILWNNAAFSKVSSSKKLGEIFVETDAFTLSKVEDKRILHCTYREKRFEVIICKTYIEERTAFAVILSDETQLCNLRDKYYDERPVQGLIYIDNYDEVLGGIDEVQRSLLLALVDSKVGKYISDIDGIIKKIEKDKYVFMIRYMYLNQLENSRFDILEEVKTINIGNEINVTLSIGIGYGEKTFRQNYSFAETAIGMALARGGDQAVVKNEGSIQYYGGKSVSVEKSTRVKARVKAQAFREILSTTDNLLIMGHKFMDIDCLGSAVGIWRIANTMGKKAHIIAKDPGGSIGQMIARYKGIDYPNDMFIDKAKAMDIINNDTVLVVVDVNRPSLTEAPELFDLTENTVVFDHHRQGSETIENALLSYVEPYASSASEMVAEMVQYISDDIRLRPAEADAMLAGIVIDTYNFTNQTGVRTFEAAAFLRKSGADVIRVRKLFRDSIGDYRAKAMAIHSAEIFMDSFAISECPAEGVNMPTVIGAQAANELLDIDGIKASVVLTKYNDMIFISARSIDEVNVQVMMERLGGGGHRSIAGAQLKGVTVEEACDQVKQVILEMIERGEIE